MSAERFRQAREVRGLTQAALAEKLGVNQSTIAGIESGIAEASESMLRTISFQTGFPISYFRQDDPPDFTFGSLLFRARVAMPALERRIAYRYGQLAFELAEKLSRRLHTPPLSLPRIEESASQAAKLARGQLGIPPDAPIERLINVLERHGVIVLASPVRAALHDAYSLWAGVNRERAVIIVAAGLAGDRLRFSVAHELRHLTCTARGSRTEIERDANLFAAEFLMPEEVMKNEIVPPVTLAGLAALKPKWGVAIQALVRRAVDLSIISDRQYRYLMQQIGMNGWRRKEPLELPPERPRALRQMAEHLYGNPIDYTKLAADVNLSTAIVRQIIELHAGKAVQVEQPKAMGRVVPIRS
jgi:Zn-dependent peptidase ImmA (M78 family)/DNA-binding XRE family transcriptional regulator